MANQARSIDFDQTPEDFEAAYANELVALKYNTDTAGNPSGALPLTLIRARLTAEYTNLIDDFLLECQGQKLRWFRTGTGTPEGNETAPVGTVFVRTDGAAGTTLYTKETGTGNTGWVAVRSASGSSTPAAHAASHLPGGTDALTTATPVAIGSALSAGAAASFARSDHVHTVQASVLDRSLYDLDFAALATNALTDGTEVIDGVNWTRVNSAADTASTITNGQGYRWAVPSSTAGTFLSGSQTAAYTYTTLALLLASHGGVDGSATYIVDCYYSALVRENGDAPIVGFWNSGETTLRAGALRFATGPVYNIGQATSSLVYSTADVGATHNVLSVGILPTGAGWVASGVWASGWPSVIDNGMIHVAGTNQQGFSRSTTRLVLSAVHGSDGTPTAAYTLSRMRIRRA